MCIEPSPMAIAQKKAPSSSASAETAAVGTGTFFEGVVTAGNPPDAAVQADFVAADNGK